MKAKELEALFNKFEALLNSINKEIEDSKIANADLGDFKLEFKNGKCNMICIIDPVTGKKFCYCA